MQFAPLPPELIWGLIPRFIGLLYVIAFGSLIPQLETMLGSRGIVPIAKRLQAIRRDFPGPRRFVEYPTVFWLHSSDRMVRWVPWIGMACGLCMMYGGPATPWALALAWLLWLSLEPAALIFPWDTLLQEVGFLALFLPVNDPLPVLEAAQLPTPTVAFMFRWFVIRLMLGFAKLKFIGANKGDSLYMRGFFVWMPLPTPLAWFGHHAPRFVLKALLGFMFLAEVIAPMLGLFAGPARLISFALLSGLMLGIQATGNWGFFNIGYVLLSFSLLDVNASIFDWAQEPWRELFWQWPHVGVNALLLILFITSLLYLVIADSWVGRTFMHLNIDSLVWNRPWVLAIRRYLRAIAPFRIVNGYGVFHPHADPPMRVVPVFEGSNDGGATWRAYRYKFQPTRPTDRAPFVAPYHPRLDMAVYYSALGGFDASFYGAYVGDGTPYTSWTRSSALDRCAQRLLENEPVVTRMFGENPFPDAPPTLVRVSAQAMTPTTNATRRATGEWWHIRRLGVFVAARGREAWPEKHAFPMPELFHPDWVDFKRRAPALQAIVRAYRNGMDPDQAVIQGSDLSAEDVRAFWETFVPEVSRARGDFSRHQERADALKAQFGVEGLVRFERILERFAWLLRVRTERHQYADAEPKIAIESGFRFHLVLHEMVTDGREAYRALLAHPASAAERAARSSDESQLWTLAMLRHDLLITHVCVFRWLSMAADAHAYKIPGIFEYYPVMAAIVPPGEVYRPRVQKLADGEHVVEGLYPPPEAHTTLEPASRF